MGKFAVVDVRKNETLERLDVLPWIWMNFWWWISTWNPVGKFCCWYDKETVWSKTLVWLVPFWRHESVFTGNLFKTCICEVCRGLNNWLRGFGMWAQGTWQGKPYFKVKTWQGQPLGMAGMYEYLALSCNNLHQSNDMGKWMDCSWGWYMSNCINILSMLA